jgi:prepilin-type N-terminal cleavage/methylation domain-containing protein
MSRHNYLGPSRPAGITLIELLVVLAVIGVLLGLILTAVRVWLSRKPAGRRSGSAPRSELSA